MAVMFALINGFIDDVAVEKVLEWEEGFHKYLESNGQEVLTAIREKKELSDDVVADLNKIIGEYKETWQG